MLFGFLLEFSQTTPITRGSRATKQAPVWPLALQANRMLG